ncbi:MAG TPA: biotin/lipoyl-binding protein [Povalibacter sp.]|nr:biotin/lipoyl-binding protein [Povalibacter sp.]
MHALKSPQWSSHEDADAVSGAAMDRALPRPPAWRRYSRHVVLAVLAIVVALLVWRQPVPARVVDSPRLAEVKFGEFRDEVALRARVEPVRSFQLDAIEAGRVEAVFVKDGDLVAAGDPLYRLSSGEMEQQLLARRAEVAQQLANVSIERSAQAASLAQNRRVLLQLEADYQAADSRYRRTKELAASGYVPAIDFEEIQLRRETAVELLEQVRRDQREEARIREVSIGEMAHAVEQLQYGLAALERAQERLDRNAPIAGRLTGFQVRVGASVGPGDRLGRIDDPAGGMQFVAEIDEYYLSHLDTGMEATSNLGTLKVMQVLPDVRDGKARAVLQQIEPSASRQLRAGQNVDIRLQMGDAVPALLIPDGPGVQSTLYVREGDGLRRRTVRLGRRGSGQVEVLGGLRAGEVVLISEPPSDAERLALP